MAAYDTEVRETDMTDQPKIWAEMTDIEKGALLLADQRGEDIEFLCADGSWKRDVEPLWNCGDAYRIKPEPTAKTVTLYGGFDGGAFEYFDSIKSVNKTYEQDDTHRITFSLVDGEPDCASIKMEKIDG